MYFYKFGSEGSGWSDVFSFVTPQPQATEVFVVAYGDIPFFLLFLPFFYFLIFLFFKKKILFVSLIKE